MDGLNLRSAGTWPCRRWPYLHRYGAAAGAAMRGRVFRVWIAWHLSTSDGAPNIALITLFLLRTAPSYAATAANRTLNPRRPRRRPRRRSRSCRCGSARFNGLVQPECPADEANVALL